ncbi:MAG: hypothetical protein U0228_31450 [Myxococcaceae bacterium]
MALDAESTAESLWASFRRPFELLNAVRKTSAWPAARKILAWQMAATSALGLLLAAPSLALDSPLASGASLFGALVAAQWVVLAFSREFQKPLARELSFLAGIEPEDDDQPPRLRLDGKWLRRRLWRRVRGTLVLIPGFLALSPVLLLAQAAGIERFVGTPLTLLWTGYWWCSFTVARSGHAWRHENSGELALPVRWWMARTRDTFGFRWFGPRWFGRFAMWATKRDAAPAVELERAPLRYLGLSLARAMTSVPVARLVFRAAIDVAVAEVLLSVEPRETPLLSEAPTPADVPAAD